MWCSSIRQLYLTGVHLRLEIRRGWLSKSVLYLARYFLCSANIASRFAEQYSEARRSRSLDWFSPLARSRVMRRVAFELAAEGGNNPICNGLSASVFVSAGRAGVMVSEGDSRSRNLEVRVLFDDDPKAEVSIHAQVLGTTNDLARLASRDSMGLTDGVVLTIAQTSYAATSAHVVG